MKNPANTNYVDCPYCEGRGYVIMSCCGDDITNNFPESDLCPTCKEHCSEDDKETCDICNGTGELPDNHPEIKNRIQDKKNSFKNETL